MEIVSLLRLANRYTVLSAQLIELGKGEAARAAHKMAVSLRKRAYRLRKRDMVRTVYGDRETVLRADDLRVVTYESFIRQSWYHPTKVFKGGAA